MREIQIEVDIEDKTAALYVSGKLITLTVPQGWGYFRLGEYKILTDAALIAYLNATACETEEDLNHFIPLFDNSEWREKLDWLLNHINNADIVKISKVRQSVAVVFRNKLFFFKRDEEGYKIGGKILQVSKDEFAAYCSAAICETETELELLIPMLVAIQPNWNEHSKNIRKHMESVLGQKRGILYFFNRLISCMKRLL
jgi:hypothetical protein